MKRPIALLLSLLALTLVFSASCKKEKEKDLLTLKYDYDLSRYIELAEYKNLPAEGYRVEVTDEAIDQQILTSRVYYARLIDVTDRPAELGDTVYIDYTATMNGEVIENGSEEDVELTIGAGSMFEDFEYALVGAWPETSLSLDLTFPDPYYNTPEYSGQDVHFEVTVHDVCTQELPDYTDDFVRAYLGYESCAAYEEAAREQLKKRYSDIYYRYIAGQIWESVVDGSKIIEWPEAELDEYYNERIEFDKAYSELLGMNMDSYLSTFYNVTEEEYYEQARVEAEDRIKEEMVCFAIARLENISLSEEEYREMALDYAEDQGYDSLEAFEAVYDRDTIRETLLQDKVVRRVVDLADVTIKN
ncbi:MAG: trigger factor [Clostridia bacterium]|nr:trigger factor [Clostridia bacterium]